MFTASSTRRAAAILSRAKALVFPGDTPGHYRFEEPDWWIKQVRSIADST